MPSTQVFHKPSAFESEIHPSHKSSICTLGISPLQGALYHSFGQCTAAMIQKKTAHCFLRCPSAYAAETAATDFSVAKRVCPSREKGVYGKTFIYTDVEAIQCQGKNILYHKPRKAGKPLCHLPPVSYTHLDVYKRQAAASSVTNLPAVRCV